MDPMPPEALLAAYPPPQRAIAERLRAIVHEAAPGVVERVRPGWRLIGYDLPIGSRRLAYFAWVMPEIVHVHLGFPLGHLMDDPDRVLAGDGVTKRARWLTFRAGERPDATILAPFVREAAAVARLTPAERFERARLLEAVRDDQG